MGTINTDDRVAVVARSAGDASRVPPPVVRGKQALYDAIDRQGGDVEEIPHRSETDRSRYVIVGTTDDRAVERLLAEVETNLSRPEGIVFRWIEIDGDSALVVAGTDERGLAYALFELAERIDDEGLERLWAVEDAVTFPDNRVRGVDRFMTGPVVDEWFYADEFWEYYLERLARCRFNRLTLITGYQTDFMAPPYPYFVDVPGYPDVSVEASVEPTREEHLDRLRTIGRRCHEYGIEFVFGTWQQRQETDLVSGIPDDPSGFADYCTGGLFELLVSCPEIDGVNLRVNYEAGVGEFGESAGAFWQEMFEAVEDAAAERERELFLDVRAKGLTDEILRRCLETGLDVSVPTKYSWEATGLPYHTVQMRSHELEDLDNFDKRRRYGYADLLREPRGYDVLYRLWAIGTNRLLLWGDPDYARRFSRSAGFGDATGFQVTAPLSTKHRDFDAEENWPLFDDPELRDYTWEDERYWAWYRLFGRLGYAVNADPDAWRREFRGRFGEAAEGFLRGYRMAGKVMPLLTSWHLTRHPAERNWAEMDTGGALFADHNYNPKHGDVTYITAEPGDPGLFFGIGEYVDAVLADDHLGKYTPVQVAHWFEGLSESVRQAVDDAAAAAGGEFERAEPVTTAIDLRTVADLAEFHASKARAAVELRFYQVTDDASFLQPAHGYMTAAIETWESLAVRTEDYHRDLVFRRDPGSRGHWRDRLTELESDRDELERLIEAADPDDGVGHVESVERRARPTQSSFATDVPDSCRAGEDLPIHVRIGELDRVAALRMHYRRADLTEGPFEEVDMTETEWGFEGIIPAEYVEPTFDLLVYFTAVDGSGIGRIIPGLYHATSLAPYRVITVEG